MEKCQGIWPLKPIAPQTIWDLSSTKESTWLFPEITPDKITAIGTIQILLLLCLILRWATCLHSTFTLESNPFWPVYCVNFRRSLQDIFLTMFLKSLIMHLCIVFFEKLRTRLFLICLIVTFCFDTNFPISRSVWILVTRYIPRYIYSSLFYSFKRFKIKEISIAG